MHAVYVMNRNPTKALIHQTPYEALFGRKPRVDHLRVFGCIGYVKLPAVNQKKLDDRGKKMVHFGVEKGSKAYRMYDPVGEKVVTSRDVRFEEKLSWLWEEISTKEDTEHETIEVEGVFDQHLPTTEGMSHNSTNERTPPHLEEPRQPEPQPHEIPPPNETTTRHPPPRRSTRRHTIPERFKDYVIEDGVDKILVLQVRFAYKCIYQDVV
ncbi:hypothetical protein E3N88_05528 [Mikania micrantha]|uniref:Retroviral polymerase SH3-like domain-containing protein n=1 Tax=Mikania micrantha TaxID=192012 RepID=A0A5N6PLY7_9ASTR|nr:hypothetical protein E3N88_05528 [Mikania micrantha]